MEKQGGRGGRKLSFMDILVLPLRQKATVLIDPFITGNPLAKVDAQELKPDVILTHGHGII